jgi:2-octaprenyl-6-methoxyphenol hydroxylase
MLAREAEALVTLTDGSAGCAAKLVVGADGRASPVRDALGIAVRTTRYGQKALAFAVAHDLPHGNISTEVHRSGGPFTLVPLPDRDGQPPRPSSGWRPGPKSPVSPPCPFRRSRPR